MQPDPQAYADVLVLAIKSALAPVVAAQAGLQAQMADLSRRVQDDAFSKELGTLRERVAIVELRPEAEPLLPDQLTPDDLTAQAADLCRKAFGDVVVPLRRIQKRIVRDGQGRIDRVIEEVAS